MDRGDKESMGSSKTNGPGYYAAEYSQGTGRRRRAHA